eukprot:205316_1
MLNYLYSQYILNSETNDHELLIFGYIRLNNLNKKYFPLDLMTICYKYCPNEISWIIPKKNIKSSTEGPSFIFEGSLYQLSLTKTEHDGYCLNIKLKQISNKIDQDQFKSISVNYKIFCYETKSSQTNSAKLKLGSRTIMMSTDYLKYDDCDSFKKLSFCLSMNILKINYKYKMSPVYGGIHVYISINGGRYKQYNIAPYKSIKQTIIDVLKLNDIDTDNISKQCGMWHWRTIKWNEYQTSYTYSDIDYSAPYDNWDEYKKTGTISKASKYRTITTYYSGYHEYSHIKKHKLVEYAIIAHDKYTIETNKNPHFMSKVPIIESSELW